METDIPPPAEVHTWIYLLIILLLLFLSALISGSEVAFFSLKEKPQWDTDPSGKENMKRIRNLLRRPQHLLATILTVNNLVNITIVIIATYLVEQWMHDAPAWWRFTVEVVIITAVILFFGEILPKVLATRNDLAFAKRTAGMLDFFNKLFMVFTYPMVYLTRRVQKYLHDEDQHFSHEELSHVLEMAKPESSTGEQRILSGILNFGQTEAKQIMKPRVDIFALDINEPFQEVIEKISRHGFSRIPVYKGDLDHIRGILFAKDLLPHLNKKDFNWPSLLRKPFFVPENIKLDDLLKAFQRRHTHLGIVVDEYGGTSGLVTLEDVIEEVLGQEIQDEYDHEKLPYRRINKNTYLFDGKIPLKDFYKYMEMPEEDVEKFEEAKGPSESLAGFFLEQYGDFPQKGDHIRFGSYELIVKEMKDNRLDKIQVIKR
ncbi:MAG: gliding motility-associated protein GldE [Chlorobi bacterium]|nr:gliding motility-associated protein GldE [Chlorobiota bacterium]